MQYNRIKLLFLLLISVGLAVGCSAYANVKYIDMSNLSPKITAQTTLKMVNASSKQTNTIKDYNKNKLDQIIGYNANKYDIPPALIKAVIKQESGFNASAVSPKGARGLMQVLPSTAADYGSYDLFQPHHNIEVGSRHLSRLLKKYNRLPLALAAYNAGEGNVNKYNGIPPFLETRNYVLRVLTFYNAGLDEQIYSTNAQSMNNSPITFEKNETVAQNVESNDKKPKVLYFSIDR